jgi:hypothetical protein
MRHIYSPAICGGLARGAVPAPRTDCIKKAIKKIFGIAALAAAIGFAAVACNSGGDGRLKGTYVSRDGFYYTFSGNKVAVTYMGVKEEGTFEIKDGKYFETGSDGITTEFDYSLEGKTLTLAREGKTIVFTKK